MVVRKQLTHPNPGYVPIIVNEGPLQALEIELEDMIVYCKKGRLALLAVLADVEMLAFIRVLVEATKSIDLIVPTVRHGSID